MKIAVHGLGYIGLPTAALFAQSGLEVVGIDISPDVTEAIRRGADGLDPTGALMLMAGITAGSFALLPFATASVLRINLR